MGYSIGQSVVILKPKVVPLEGQGHYTWWVSGMDKLVGETHTIKRCYEDSNEYSLKDTNYTWIDEWFEDPVLTLINEVTR